MKIGLVGLGRMGTAMSHRLREHGFDIVGWDGDANRNKALAASGLQIAANPRAVAAEAEIVISIITEDHGVRHIFGDADGFLAGDVKGKLFIEMSTLQPMTARELAPLVNAKGARLIDSPVLGTIPQVKDGKLFALVGGRAEDLDSARPVLEKMTRRIAHMGPNGTGYAMKLAVNLGLGAYIQALSESLALGAKQGLTLDQMLEVLQEAPVRERLDEKQDRRDERREARNDPRHPYIAEGHHVGCRYRRAEWRSHATISRHTRVAVGSRRQWIRRRRSRRDAEVSTRGDAAKFRITRHR